MRLYPNVEFDTPSARDFDWHDGWPGASCLSMPARWFIRTFGQNAFWFFRILTILQISTAVLRMHRHLTHVTNPRNRSISLLHHCRPYPFPPTHQSANLLAPHS